MNKSKLDKYIAFVDDDIYKVAYIYLRLESTVYIVDKENHLIGGIGLKELSKTFVDDSLTVGDIINDKINVIFENDSIDMIYIRAAAIFANNDRIQTVPIINNDRCIIDVLTRERVFFEKYYLTKRLERWHYAHNMIAAAKEAKKLNVNAISAIEFGVAGGNGLVIMEQYAKEITRITGIRIDVYGFDTGAGMPLKNEGYKDMIHFWSAGVHGMNVEKLMNRLEKATLIIGNVEETTPTFCSSYNPARIGVVFVDVDYYSSTKPILYFLSHIEDRYAMPRIHMYFDDTMLQYEFSGETLAIKEFNAEHDEFKISPELTYDNNSKNKICHRFNHELYNDSIVDNNKDLRLR